MREIVSVTWLLLLAVRCTRLMRLVRWDLCSVGEIDDELDEVSQVHYDEVCEVGESDEWRWTGWGLWSPSSLWVMTMMTDKLDNVSKVGESILHRERDRLMNGKMVKSSMAKSLPVENLVNYQLLAVIYWRRPMGTPSCSRPQPATHNGVRDGWSKWLVAPSGSLPPCIAHSTPLLAHSTLVHWILMVSASHIYPCRY